MPARSPGSSSTLRDEKLSVNGAGSCNDYVLFIADVIRDLLSQRAQRGISESEKAVINQKLSQEVSKIQSQLKIPLLTDVAHSKYFDDLDVACNVTQIVTMLGEGQTVYPDWFRNSINNVSSGQLNPQEFLNSYYYLVDEGSIHSITESEPELPSIPEPPPIQETTFDIVEYRLHNGSVHSKSKYNVLQSYLNELDSSNVMWKLQGAGYTNQEVYDFYNYVLPSIEEPEEPYVYSECIDVYRLSNGRVTKTRETVGYQTMADYVNVQHLLVRACDSVILSDQEVRDYYGYVSDVPGPEDPIETTADIPPPQEKRCYLVRGIEIELTEKEVGNLILQNVTVTPCSAIGGPTPEPSDVPIEIIDDPAPPTTEEPEVTVVTPTEKFVVSKPGRFTMLDMTNTNSWVGILLGGILAVPVFSSILSKRK